MSDNVTTVIVTVLDVLVASLTSAIIAGTLYFIVWMLVQLDYLDLLDPEDLTSLPPHLEPHRLAQGESQPRGIQ